MGVKDMDDKDLIHELWLEWGWRNEQIDVFPHKFSIDETHRVLASEHHHQRNACVRGQH